MAVTPNVIVALGEPCVSAVERHLGMLPTEDPRWAEWRQIHRFLAVEELSSAPRLHTAKDPAIRYWSSSGLADVAGDALEASKSTRHLSDAIIQMDASIRGSPQLGNLEHYKVSGHAGGLGHGMQIRHIIMADLANPLCRGLLLPLLAELKSRQTYQTKLAFIRLVLLFETRLGESTAEESRYGGFRSIASRDIPDQDEILNSIKSQLLADAATAKAVIDDKPPDLKAWFFNDRDPDIEGGQNLTVRTSNDARELFLDILAVVTLGDHATAKAMTDPEDPSGVGSHAGSIGMHIVSMPDEELRKVRVGFSLASSDGTSGLVNKLLGDSPESELRADATDRIVKSCMESYTQALEPVPELEVPDETTLKTGLLARTWINNQIQRLEDYSSKLHYATKKINEKLSGVFLENFNVARSFAGDGKGVSRNVTLRAEELLRHSGLRSSRQFVEGLADTTQKKETDLRRSLDWSFGEVPWQSFGLILTELDRLARRKPRIRSYLAFAVPIACIGLLALIFLIFSFTEHPWFFSILAGSIYTATAYMIFNASRRAFKEKLSRIRKELKSQLEDQGNRIREHFMRQADRLANLWQAKSLYVISCLAQSISRKLQRLENGLAEAAEDWRKDAIAFVDAHADGKPYLVTFWKTHIPDNKAIQKYRVEAENWAEETERETIVNTLQASRILSCQEESGEAALEIIDALEAFADSEITKRAPGGNPLAAALKKSVGDDASLSEEVLPKKVCTSFWVEDPGILKKQGHVLYVCQDRQLDFVFEEMKRQYAESSFHSVPMFINNSLALIRPLVIEETDISKISRG